MEKILIYLQEKPLVGLIPVPIVVLQNGFLSPETEAFWGDVQTVFSWGISFMGGFVVILTAYAKYLEIKLIKRKSANAKN